MYLFIDTETNDAPPNWRAGVRDVGNWPRIVQVAWTVDDGSGDVPITTRVVKPDGWTIAAGAERVHGLSLDYCETVGHNMATVMDELEFSIRQCRQIVAHNIGFDFPVIVCEQLRLNRESSIDALSQRCTMLETTDWCAIPSPHRVGQYKWPSLAELYRKLFDADFSDAHSADADVDACRRCFFELRRRELIRH